MYLDRIKSNHADNQSNLKRPLDVVKRLNPFSLYALHSSPPKPPSAKSERFRSSAFRA
jgi:hypothetical protein